MTRARVKALHDKVNSLLSMCDLDTPLNGLLLHSDTLCILRNNYHEDLQERRVKRKMKKQSSGTTAEKAGTTARRLTMKLKREKLQAAVLPPPPAVLPPAPGSVVPLEVPPTLPARLQKLLSPTVSVRYRPCTTASAERK